ncbi:hypothetical protein WA171_000109, partial [Blastocystis sp. BT1]
SSFVIQCAKCRSIVSDSSCNVLINDALHLIVTERANNTTIENQLKLAIGQLDEGSSYFEISCSFCHAILGRSYKSTTDYSDAYRDRFAFDMDKVTTYTLGSCTQSRRDDSIPSQSSNAILLSFDADRARNDTNAINEIKSIILHMNQRLDAFEASH